MHKVKKLESLVSVIVPAYNYAHFLGDALQSVLQQTHHNWECIIVDDGSTDDTELVAKKFVALDNRFVYVNQQNQGLAASRNNGMKIAKGVYFQFLDADDKIAAQKLMQQALYLDNHAGVDVVYGDYRFFRTESPEDFFQSKDGSKRSPEKQKMQQNKRMLPVLIENNFTVVSAPLIRRSIADSGIVFDTGFTSYEDWKFWIECALADFKFDFVDKPETMTYIRFGHSSMMSALLRMNENGRRLRMYLNRHLKGGPKMYNSYRLLKLILKNYYLKMQKR